MPERLTNIREYLIQSKVVNFTWRPYNSLRVVQNQAEQTRNNLNEILQPYEKAVHDLQKASRGDVGQYSKSDQQKIIQAVKNLQVYGQVEKIIWGQYQATIKTAFPNSEVKKIPALQQEAIYMYLMYYNPITSC